MANQDIRKRLQATLDEASFIVRDRPAGKEDEPHPAGEAKYGPAVEVLRLLLVITYFLGSCIAINVTQLIGAPLYFYNKDYYYAYMALTKQSFGILVTTLTQWFSPTVIRVSWDSSVRGQLWKGKDGRLETKFPERLVLIANHQIYTDWLYLWWTAYTSHMHGHLYIILKESLKFMPILSPGILFFGFIFMARKWQSDKERMQYRLQKLKSKHSGPLSGSQTLDPMWLMIFPEGTNLSRNTRKDSVKWSEKSGIPDLRHLLLPRSTGMQFCLEQLGDSVEYVYDCTMAYEGVPKGEYAPEYFTLRSTYFQGRPPKSVNMHWRRYKISEIPYQDHKAFDKWVLDRWKEKDEMLEQYYNTGRFPSDNVSDTKAGIEDGYIETEVKLRSWLEVGQVFAVLLALAMVSNVVVKVWEMFF
jgi:1-acyl-sn-glycerol-3-phosphate acyltransferase